MLSNISKKGITKKIWQIPPLNLGYILQILWILVNPTMEEEERKITEVQFWLNFFLNKLQFLTEKDHEILSSFHHKTWKNPRRVKRSATKREDLIMKKFLLANKSYRSTVNDMRNKRAVLGKAIVIQYENENIFFMPLKCFLCALFNCCYTHSCCLYFAQENMLISLKGPFSLYIYILFPLCPIFMSSMVYR